MDGETPKVKKKLKGPRREFAKEKGEEIKEKRVRMEARGLFLRSCNL